MTEPTQSIWLEVTRAVPSVVTAITAIVGVVVAKAGLSKWRAETIGKRKAELAEDVLADFYEARDVIQAARSPAKFANEGASRKRADWESLDDTRTLNSYYATAEHLDRNSEFFSKLYARRYRFLAHFGKEAAAPYEDVRKIYNEIIIAVRMLIVTHQDYKQGKQIAGHDRWEQMIWWQGDDDLVPKRLDAAIEAIEKTCRPAIQDAAR